MGIQGSGQPSRQGILKDKEKSLEKKCRELLSKADTAEAAIAYLEELKLLMEVHPNHYQLELTALLLREKTRIKKGMLESWLAFCEKHPYSLEAERYCVRWMYRLHMHEEARKFIRERYNQHKLETKKAIHLSQLYSELRDFTSAENILQEAMKHNPDYPQLRVVLAKNMKVRGKFAQAWDILQPLFERGSVPPSAITLRKELERGIHALDAIAPGKWRHSKNIHLDILYYAILHFREKRPPEPDPLRLGAVTLLTGSLGAGGAERQMVNTAVQFIKRQRAGEIVDGMQLEGPFEILVTALNTEDGKDFYHQQALAGGVPVKQVQNIPPQKLEEICPDDPVLSALLPLLPPVPLYGVQRAVHHFREYGTEIAYIWQDGAVLLAALAALIAGVPRIVINFRGLPPVLRRHLFREEYEPLYKALAQVPGVSFASNGKVTAQAYAEWIGIPPERITVVPNGIMLLSPKEDEDDIATWETFRERTRDADQTIGGVFRFDTDKRPLLWMQFAGEYLKRNPRARFLLVGDGRLMDAARERAEKFGIAERTLFVGQSTNVPFWLEKMDVHLLLSRFEGLPNVLIEAQMMGVPVVSTPAGNAVDTFIEGETGFILSELENPSVEEICEKVEAAMALKERDPRLPEKASCLAKERFSIDSMVRNTVRLLTGR